MAIDAREQRLFTVDEYHLLAEAGILGPDERVELIRGVIRTMFPKSRLHVIVSTILHKVLMRPLEERASVYAHAPLQLPSLDSEPEPDILVGSNPDLAAYGTDETEPLLVVEVADSSLGYDLGEKAALYAEAGIPEYWVVNLVERVVEVFRQPRAGRFEGRRAVGAGERLAPGAWSDAVVDLASLFRDL